MRSRRLKLLATVLLGIAAVTWLLIPKFTPEPDAVPQQDRTTAPSAMQLAPDLQEEGPLLEGEEISLEEAKAETSYDLARPENSTKTGELAGIWIDNLDQVAFVWETNLRFYQNRLDPEITQSEMAELWENKIKEEQDIPWVSTKVRGQPAIGVEGQVDREKAYVSGLTFVENGLVLQFVSNTHDLSELSEMAEEVRYEKSGTA